MAQGVRARREIMERHTADRLLNGGERVHEAGRAHGAVDQPRAENGSHVAAMVLPEPGQMSLTVRQSEHNRLRLELYAWVR